MEIKKSIVFDIDGTIADNTHRQHHLRPPLVKDNDDTRFGSCDKCEASIGESHKETCPYLRYWKKDWDAFFDPAAQMQDLPVEAMKSVFHALLHRNFEMVFLTGRLERNRPDTEEWLRIHGFTPYHQLIMRPTDSRVDDSELKLQQAAESIGLENIAFVFEDRHRVVAAWRAAGIFCFHVGGGDF